MKKYLAILMLIFVALISDAANRTGAIRAGDTQLSKPMTFGASDTINTSETVTITIQNVQKYLQHQTFTTTLTAVSGSPSVAVTAYGKVTAGGSWVQIGSPVTWTSSGNNPVTITSAAPLNYNYLKLSYVASGATQHVKISSFEVKTANIFSLGGGSAYVLGNTGATMAISSSDWTIGATGVATGLGNITSDGKITAKDSVCLNRFKFVVIADTLCAVKIGGATLRIFPTR